MSYTAWMLDPCSRRWRPIPGTEAGSPERSALLLVAMRRTLPEADRPRETIVLRTGIDPNSTRPALVNTPQTWLYGWRWPTPGERRRMAGLSVPAVTASNAGTRADGTGWR